MRLVLLSLALGATIMAHAGTFEDLGIPCVRASALSRMVGSDANGENTKVYLGFNQDAPLFILQCDPVTGETRQFNAPEGAMCAWALTTGKDGKIYTATCEGGTHPGSILVLDPTKPDEGLKLIGRPADSESYIWELVAGTDGKIYGCTYPGAKLVSYDPATGKLADLGRMDEQEQYAREIAAGDDGWIYTGIGMVRGNIVGYNTATGEHKSMLTDEERLPGCGVVHTASDGIVYGRIGAQWHRFSNGQATKVAEHPGPKPRVLKDGRILVDSGIHDYYELIDPKTNEKQMFKPQYRGDGSMVFVVGEGPRGLIFGGSAVPLSMWQFDPATSQSEDFGNPTDTDGEIYSILTHGDDVYVCAYGGAYLSRYTPGKPWDFGRTPDKNPFSIGPVGDGHLRPRAMVHGPDGMIYIGSLPPYGQLGGAMAVFDPRQNKVIENYRHLVPDQGIVALAWDQKTGYMIGGSSIWGGGGSTPKAKDIVFFAWDSAAKKKVWEITPVPGDENTEAVCVVDGKAFFTSRGSQNLTVVDTATGKLLHQKKSEFGFPLEISLGVRNGLIYGLTDTSIITIDPMTYEVKQLEKIPGGANTGFALTDTGLYYGKGVHLWRYKW